MSTVSWDDRSFSEFKRFMTIMDFAFYGLVRGLPEGK